MNELNLRLSMPIEPKPKKTKYRIKVSVARQESLTVSAISADIAVEKLEKMLNRELGDPNSTLEHYVICSVEESD